MIILWCPKHPTRDDRKRSPGKCVNCIANHMVIEFTEKGKVSRIEISQQDREMVYEIIKAAHLRSIYRQRQKSAAVGVTDDSRRRRGHGRL